MTSELACDQGDKKVLLFSSQPSLFHQHPSSVVGSSSSSLSSLFNFCNTFFFSSFLPTPSSFFATMSLVARHPGPGSLTNTGSRGGGGGAQPPRKPGGSADSSGHYTEEELVRECMSWFPSQLLQLLTCCRQQGPSS